MNFNQSNYTQQFTYDLNISLGLVVQYIIIFLLKKFNNMKNILCMYYCILCGRIKRYNSSLPAIMCQVDSYRTVVG